jgi:hypothetical protein
MESTEQGFPAELPPSPTLLRIPNIVRMKFELKQVICDTFHSSYVLIVLIVCALVPVCRPRRTTLRIRRMFPSLKFAGSFLT